MKNLLLISVVFLTICCNGDRKPESFSNIKSSIKPDTLTTHHKDEDEIIDTILDSESNFRVFIKKKSLVDKYVNHIYDIDTNTNTIGKHIFHDNSILIKVMLDKNVLLDTLLLKDKLSQIEDKDF